MVVVSGRRPSEGVPYSRVCVGVSFSYFVLVRVFSLCAFPFVALVKTTESGKGTGLTVTNHQPERDLRLYVVRKQGSFSLEEETRLRPPGRKDL